MTVFLKKDKDLAFYIKLKDVLLLVWDTWIIIHIKS